MLVIRNKDLIFFLIADQSTFAYSFMRTFFYPTLIWEDLYSEYFFMLQYDPANPNLYASRLFLLLMTFPFVEHMTFFRGHHVVGIHNMSVL